MPHFGMALRKSGGQCPISEWLSTNRAGNAPLRNDSPQIGRAVPTKLQKHSGLLCAFHHTKAVAAVLLVIVPNVKESIFGLKTPLSAKIAMFTNWKALKFCCRFVVFPVFLDVASVFSAVISRHGNVLSN